MQRWMIGCLAAGIACSWATAQTPPRLQQSDRRDRMFPELVVDSKGRRGSCDVLTFTADGKHLLAAGDDKVVRTWEYRNGRVDPKSEVLRWPVWREQRGAIYAMALPSDPQDRRVAIGGKGPYDTSAAVLDRQSGKILHMVHAKDPKMQFGSVWAIAFSPQGDRIAFGSADGSVWLWRPKTAPPKRLGQHHRMPDRKYNFIRLVRFLDDQELLSVAESGEVLRWDLTAKPPKPSKQDILDDVTDRFFKVELSRDGKWIAAAAARRPLIAVRSLDGKASKDIELKEGTLAVSLAFDADGGRLAVGIRSRLTEIGSFHLEPDDRICLYDLSKKEAALEERLPHSWRADALAFHPDGRHLGVAGGDNHEVTLWDLNQAKEPARVLSGVGSGLWSVGFSKNGRYLAFQTQRQREPKHPNQRGRGPWMRFDLEQRRLRPAPAGFTPLSPRQELHGWRVKPDPKDSPYVWYVEHAGMEIRHKLHLNKDWEAKPNCYTFLPGREDEPVRLAVGHYWGVSVYEVTEKAARRLWLGIGHQGEVMAVAASPSGDWLVSASTDQTISAWKLSAWPCGSELGATFRKEKGRVFVDKVDLFSPAWEAGLAEKDEVVQLMVSPEPIYRRLEAGGPGPQCGSADACLEALAAPEPGQSLNFRILRPGNKKVFKQLTTARRRPLWRFFPTVTNEWVLWMWGHHYYDTSNNGDSYLGWQMNNGADLEKSPSFYRAEQFREPFHNPAVIDKLLTTRNIRKALEVSDAGLEPPNFGNFESASVRIKVRERDNGDVEVILDIEPRTQNPDYVPEQAELWLNDHRLVKPWKLNGKAFHHTLILKRDKLRAGDNDLVLQCYNKVAGRGRGRLEDSVRVHCPRGVGELKRKLFGLVVGITDYRRSAPDADGNPCLGDLHTPLRDVKAIRQVWLDQEGLLYSKVEIKMLPGKDGKADRQTILNTLRGFAEKVGPDDHLFVFFAGHGWVAGSQGKRIPAFCCPDYDPRKLDTTSISAVNLYEALADISCRKVVFLDICHSGGFCPVRDLTPNGRGPTILAACDSGESSYEDPVILQHGLFAKAILDAAGEQLQFKRADRNHDGQLDAQEIYDFVSKRVPELAVIAKLQVAQTPVSFPAELERNPLLSQKPEKLK